MDRISIILMAISAVAVLLALVPIRAPRRKKTRADLRREWSQARPHWTGHDGWEGHE